jgi:hypothetical protein
MKDIDLPITNTVTMSIDLAQLDEEAAVEVDGRLLVPTKVGVNEQSFKELEQARVNGGKILYATTTIEHQLDDIILHYFMGVFVYGFDARELFEKEMLQSSLLSFSAKKELAIKIINQIKLLKGKDKNSLQNGLKNIMEWRNGFAHGKLNNHSSNGCYLHYYSGKSISFIKYNPKYETSFIL